MKIIYPGGFKDKNKYSKTLISRYSEIYPEFSMEQLEAPIVRVVNNISYDISCFELYEHVIANIFAIKQFLISSYPGISISRTSGKGVLLRYSRGDEELLRRLMKDDFPEGHREKYLKFVSEMTKNAIREICQETEKSIPHSAKIEYQRWLDGGRSDVDAATETVQATFVERLEKENVVSQKKTSFTDIIRKNDGEEDMAFSKKKRHVVFEDEGIKKKINLSERDEEEIDSCTDAASINNGDVTSKVVLEDSNTANTQRSIGTEEQIDYTPNNNGKIREEKIADEYSNHVLVNPQLTKLYAWIYELPEWLQNQVLNSTPIKGLIESAEQMAAIYDIKSIQDIVTKMLSPEAQSPVDGAEYDLYEKAQISDMRPIEPIDMSMLYKDATVTGWILPTVGMESGNMFVGDAAFNGLGHFHGIELF